MEEYSTNLLLQSPWSQNEYWSNLKIVWHNIFWWYMLVALVQICNVVCCLQDGVTSSEPDGTSQNKMPSEAIKLDMLMEVILGYIHDTCYQNGQLWSLSYIFATAYVCSALLNAVCNKLYFKQISFDQQFLWLTPHFYADLILIIWLCHWQ